MWRDPQNNMLSEKYLTQKTNCCVIPFMWYLRTGRSNLWYQNVDYLRTGQDTVEKGYKKIFWNNSNFLYLDLHGGYMVKISLNYTFKICILYLNKILLSGKMYLAMLIDNQLTKIIFFYV